MQTVKAGEAAKVEVTTIRPWLYVEHEMSGKEIVGIAERREVDIGEVITVNRQLAQELVGTHKAVVGKHAIKDLYAQGIAQPRRKPEPIGSSEDDRIARIVAGVLASMGVTPKAAEPAAKA